MEKDFHCQKDTVQDETYYTLAGIMDEAINIKGLFQDSGKRLIIDMGKVTRINSTATRDWINEISALPPGYEIVFTCISIPVVRQFNMVDNMSGSGTVEKFLAPYYCPDCDRDFEKEVVIKDNIEELRKLNAPQHNCPDCQKELEFDDIERKYFHFLVKKEG